MAMESILIMRIITPHPPTHTHPTQPNKKIPATININVEHLDDIFFHLSVFSPFISGWLFITRVAALQSYDRLYITTLHNVEYRSAKKPRFIVYGSVLALFIVTHMFSYCTCNNLKLNKILFSLSIWSRKGVNITIMYCFSYVLWYMYMYKGSPCVLRRSSSFWKLIWNEKSFLFTLNCITKYFKCYS